MFPRLCLGRCLKVGRIIPNPSRHYRYANPFWPRKVTKVYKNQPSFFVRFCDSLWPCLFPYAKGALGITRPTSRRCFRHPCHSSLERQPFRQAQGPEPVERRPRCRVPAGVRGRPRSNSWPAIVQHSLFPLFRGNTLRSPGGGAAVPGNPWFQLRNLS